MLGAESESMVYVALPVGQSLVGKAEHEVYADIADVQPMQCLYSPCHLIGSVASANQAEPAVTESLGSHTYTVYLWRQAETCATHVVGITFDGDFGVVAHPIPIIYIGDESVEIAGREHAGRTSPQIDGIDAVGRGLAHVKFVAHGVDITILDISTCGTVKATVGTTRCTERYVNV